MSLYILYRLGKKRTPIDGASVSLFADRHLAPHNGEGFDSSQANLHV